MGTDSFSYTVSDGNGGTDSATVSITVTNANDAPLANDDAASVAEDSGASAIAVLTNDTDSDSDQLSVSSVTQGANGAVVITGGGTGLTYAPNANFVGTDSFSYTVSDGNGGSDSATVSITVTGVNDAPNANNDAASVAEDSGANAINVLANDTDPEGNTLSVSSVTQGSNGAVVITGGGTGLTYAPNANFVGTDSFSYTVSDGNGGSDSATVSITVTNVNDAPVATNDSYTTDEDVVLSVAAPGVIANDTDGDGNTLAAALVAGPANGTLTLNANGSFSYTPNANFNGSDSFSYRASDGVVNSNVATVTITINPVADNPVAVDDAATVMQGSTATTINVLANDTSATPGGTLTITAVTPPAHGTVTINGGTSVSYTPAAGYAGADSFTYTIQDASGSDTATVAMTVQARPSITINDANIVEGNSGTVDATIQVSLSHAVVAPVTVRYATADGIARAGKDYVASSGTVTFAAGESSKPVIIKVIGETTKERDETFAVSLSLPTNATIARTSGFITILDDDSTPTATVSGTSTKEGGTSGSTLASNTTSPSTLSLVDSSLPTLMATVTDASEVQSEPVIEKARFTITLTNPSEIPIAVDFRTSDGTGIAGLDYTAMSGTLTFTEDETVKVIEVPLSPDLLHEADEVLTIQLSNPVALTLGNSAASSVIVDDDPAPFIEVTDVVVLEGNAGTTNAVFTVTMASAAGKPETVKYSTANGTATAGSDYVAVSGELTFKSGVTVQTITVPILGDTASEADETFTVTLMQASDAPVIHSRATATITNDDRELVPAVSISDASVVEGNAGVVNAQFVVSLSSPAPALVTVAYATADGTATAGADYGVATGTVTFVLGQQSAVVTVPVVADVLDEKSESFVVNLALPVGATIGDGQGIGVIEDDDAAAWTTSTVADFSTGTVDSGAFVASAPDGDGSLTLLPASRTEFTGTALPAGWSTSLKSKSGMVRVADDQMTIDYATVTSTTLYTVNRSAEFSAVFSGATNQYAGFGNAQFIVKADGVLYARSVSSTVTETPLGKTLFGAPHRFAIVWKTGSMVYEVDGQRVAEHLFGSIPTQMTLVFADVTAAGGGALVVDWLRVSPYASAGSFTSKVYDAGEPVAWLQASASARVPEGTGLVISIRTGGTPTPDGTWTPFSTLQAGGAMSGTARYAQYRVEMNTTAVTATPVLNQMIVTYERK